MSAASSPEFGTSDTEKSERTAFLQDNADKSQAFPQSAANRLESPHPEIRCEPVERLGRPGMVTVWDEHGRIVGCMGVELWKALLTVEANG